MKRRRSNYDKFPSIRVPRHLRIGKTRGRTGAQPGPLPPEVYEIWDGTAYIYMQEHSADDPGRCYAVVAKPGDIVVVPPAWALQIAWLWAPSATVNTVSTMTRSGNARASLGIQSSPQTAKSNGCPILGIVGPTLSCGARGTMRNSVSYMAIPCTNKRF
jgi:hypothetical protein